MSLDQIPTENTDNISWPKVNFVPAMQRRRLSPFAKMALFTAEHALNSSTITSDESIPIVFASRHGDLHKTTELLIDLAKNETLSPTAFGLSVHNAVPSLYSIFKANKQEINAISAGQDSFFMGLVDAYARLKSGRCNQVLFIYSEQVLPEIYQEFNDEVPLDNSVAIVLSLASSTNHCNVTFMFEPTLSEYKHHEGATLDDSQVKESLLKGSQLKGSLLKGNFTTPLYHDKLPISLAFYQWITDDRSECHFKTNRYFWQCNKNV